MNRNCWLYSNVSVMKAHLNIHLCCLFLPSQGLCNSSWPACLPTTETPVLHLLHCKHFSFSINLLLISSNFVWQPLPLFLSPALPLSVCVSDPACYSCTQTLQITRGVREVWTPSSQGSVISHVVISRHCTPFLLLAWFPFIPPSSLSQPLVMNQKPKKTAFPSPFSLPLFSPPIHPYSLFLLPLT